MKKTKLFAALGIGLVSLGLAVGATAGAAKAEPVHAADPTTKWAAIGTIGGTNWNTDFGFTWDATDNRFELTMNMSANQEFKLRYNKTWSKEISYDNNFNPDSNIKTYLSQSGTNFKVKVNGNYTLCLNKDIESWTNGYAWALTIVQNVEKADVTITYYDGETLLKTVTAKEDDLFAPIFAEKEGYRLEGWYTDAELTTKIAKGTALTSSMSVYANYVEAEGYTVYVFDSANALQGTPNVHLWRNQLDGESIDTWPGLATTATSVAGVYSIEIDASKSCDSIIFNGGNNKPQTIDLTLATEDTLYVLGAKDAEGKYAASTVTVSVAGLSEYIMAEDTEGQCVAKYPIANTVYLLLSAEEQETFTTDAAHADAKTRYEAWALSLGQTPYVAMSSTKGLLTKMTSENNLMVVILVITASVIACAVAFKLVKKSRKEN